MSFITSSVGKWLQNSFDEVEVGLFQPKARAYFEFNEDSPADAPESEKEVDLFRDGSLVPTIEIVQLRLRSYFGDAYKTEGTKGEKEKVGERTGVERVSAGFTLGLGISAPLSEDSTTEASAPIVLASAGVMLAYDISDSESKPAIGVEAGVVGGLSADESIGDSTDGAWYIGVSVNFTF
jgi:hypothetical protein